MDPCRMKSIKLLAVTMSVAQSFPQGTKHDSALALAWLFTWQWRVPLELHFCHHTCESEAVAHINSSLPRQNMLAHSVDFQVCYDYSFKFEGKVRQLRRRQQTFRVKSGAVNKRDCTMYKHGPPACLEDTTCINNTTNEPEALNRTYLCLPAGACKLLMIYSFNQVAGKKWCKSSHIFVYCGKKIICYANLFPLPKEPIS